MSFGRNGWLAESSLAVRVGLALGLTFAFLVVPAFADQWVYAHLNHRDIYDRDWARLLRLTGWLPTWWLVALVVWLDQRRSTRDVATRRAWLMFWTPAAGGLVAEILKLLIRRERPEFGDGEWVFRAFSDRTFVTAGLATPSSHTMVAFAAATMFARLYPSAKWVFYVLAWGCAVTRVLSRAHYISDVTFGALLGWAVGWALYLQFNPREMRATP